MKKYLSILLITLTLVIVPQITHAGVLEDLYQQITQLQQLILQLISKQNSVVSEAIENRVFRSEVIQSVDYVNKIIYLPPKFFKSNVPNPNSPIKIKVTGDTIIGDLRGPSKVDFSSFKEGEEVYIRSFGSGFLKGVGSYTATHVFIMNKNGLNSGHSGFLLGVRARNGSKLTVEQLSGRPENGRVFDVTIFSGTEVRKGRPEQGENRPIVSSDGIEVGDILSGFVAGNFNCTSTGCAPLDETSYLIEADIVKPYYCQESYKPKGCIESNAGQQTYNNSQYGFSIAYPKVWTSASVFFDPYLNVRLDNGFRLQGYPPESGYTLSKFTNTSWFHNSNDPYTSISIGGQPAVRYDLVVPIWLRGESTIPTSYTRSIQIGVVTPNGSFLTAYYDKTFKTENEARNADMSKADEYFNWIKFTSEPGDNVINLSVINKGVKLGDVITVIWDASKIPSNAQGIGLHIVRPDGDYVSATGVVGVKPALGRISLQQLPKEPFYGFVENGNYYIQALVTDTRDPNGNILIRSRSDFFKINK